jgi:endonuclease/exonuclease/phosphatase family metal-dependent hydrolase
MNDTYDIRQRYIGQVYSALKYYKDLLKNSAIIIGDFNWNAIWDDSPDNPLHGNLADVVELLKSHGIQSAYHEFYREDFGKETKPTFFMHHKQEKPYHIDYCFASSDFSVQQVDVRNFDSWIKKSDHMPLVVTLE